MTNADFSMGPCPGDIALMRGGAKRSSMVVRMQKFVRADANFSHVLLNISGRLWIEAVPFEGVRIVTTSEAFLQDECGIPPLIIRPPQLEEKNDKSNVNDDNYAAAEALDWVNWTVSERFNWLMHALYYTGQRYNFWFLFPKHFADRTKFCSELIAAIYLARGMSPFGEKKATSTLPSDLEALQSRGWLRWPDEKFRYYLEQQFDADSPISENSERDHYMNCVRNITDSNISEFSQLEVRARVYILLVDKGLHGARETAVAELEKILDKIKVARESLKSNRFLLRGAPWLGGAQSEKKIEAVVRKFDKVLRDGGRILGKI